MKKLLAILLIALVACAHIEEATSQVDEYEDPQLQFLGFLVPIFKAIGTFFVKKLAFGKIASFVGKAVSFGKKVFTGVKHFVKPIITKFKGTKLVQRATKIYHRFKNTNLFKTGQQIYKKIEPLYKKYKQAERISDVVSNVRDVVEGIKQKKEMERLQKQYEEMERKYEEQMKSEEEAIRKEEEALEKQEKQMGIKK